MTREGIKIAVIIPAYKVTDHIVDLVARIEDEVTRIYIVDDCCPDNSGDYAQKNITDERVVFMYNKVNLGVGGAVSAGLLRAKQDGMDIGIKIDGDGQMDPAILHKFVAPIVANHADYTKGNRFFNPQNVKGMPAGRILGNSILSFVSKFSTGYWNVFDPTNGYLALDLRILEFIQLDKVSKRYFFETDILFRCNLIRAKVVDIPMVAIYEDEVSNLNFGKEAFRFMAGHIKNFIKRIGYNYFLRDFNIASAELVLGVIAILFGAIYGIFHLGGTAAASAGTVMVSALPIISGFLLLLSFLNYDIQQVPRDTISKYLSD